MTKPIKCNGLMDYYGLTFANFKIFKVFPSLASLDAVLVEQQLNQNTFASEVIEPNLAPGCHTPELFDYWATQKTYFLGYSFLVTY